MLRFYFRMTLLLTLLLMVSSAAMLAIGSAQPINPALAEMTEGCEGAAGVCWYGIRSGTTLENARALLAQHGFSESAIRMGFTHGQPVEAYHRPLQAGCNTVTISYLSASSDPQITIDSLGQCLEIYAGDMIGVFGEPDMITFRGETGFLVFEHGLQAQFSGQILPFTALYVIIPSTLFPPNAEVALRWEGFMLAWRYCFGTTPDRCFFN